MAERDDLDRLIRGNPAYRDIDLVENEPSPEGSTGPRKRRLADIPRHPDRPLAWRLLGLPAPRELVRALVIDGYPTSTHRWAFGRVSSSIGWSCVAIGVFGAALTSWLISTIGGTADAIIPALFVLGVLCLGVAAGRLLPILQALRYAARWNREMDRTPKH